MGPNDEFPVIDDDDDEVEVIDEPPDERTDVSEETLREAGLL